MQTIRGYPDDDFVSGAITVALKDNKPHVGMIVQVEQQSWNALKRGWDKTVLVRCGRQEFRVNPHASEMIGSKRQPSLQVLLRVADTLAVRRTMQDLAKAAHHRTAGKLLLPKAS